MDNDNIKISKVEVDILKEHFIIPENKIDYIKEKYPNLLPLYEDIYTKKDRAYWSQLDEEMRAFTKEQGLIYVRDDDSIKRPFEEPPIIVNYFFHEELTPSAKKAAKKRT